MRNKRDNENRINIPKEDILFTLVNYQYSCAICKVKHNDSHSLTNEGLIALAITKGGSNLEYISGFGFDYKRSITKTGFEIHHIKPVAKLGENENENLMPLCVKCHDFIHQKKEMPNEVIDILYSHNYENVKNLDATINEVFEQLVINLK
jgi:hypothetical protein